eukprot:gene31298-27802_t
MAMCCVCCCRTYPCKCEIGAKSRGWHATCLFIAARAEQAGLRLRPGARAASIDLRPPWLRRSHGHRGVDDDDPPDVQCTHHTRKACPCGKVRGGDSAFHTHLEWDKRVYNRRLNTPPPSAARVSRAGGDPAAATTLS